MKAPATTALRLDLPWPPSVNHYWRTPRTGPLRGRTLISEAGRLYRAAVAAAVLEQRAALRLSDRLAVDIQVFEPDRRSRDIDNLLKAVLDSLTHAGVWDDDGQIDDLRIWRHRDTRGGMLRITIHKAQSTECNES